jgi:Glycosyltransferase family 20
LPVFPAARHSNDVLWPLFHYVPLPMYKAGGEKKFDSNLWEAYKEANNKFADVVSAAYKVPSASITMGMPLLPALLAAWQAPSHIRCARA